MFIILIPSLLFEAFQRIIHQDNLNGQCEEKNIVHKERMLLFYQPNFYWVHGLENLFLNIIFFSILQITVTLKPEESLGLSIRGGREYGLGIFVTGVERNSAAEKAGIRVRGRLYHN